MSATSTVPLTEPAPVLERPVTIEGPEPIPAILVIPDRGGPWPAVVILHGAGARKEDNLVDARSLAARGVLACLIDLAGHGERPNHITDESDGLIPILDYLRACDTSADDVLLVARHLRSDATLCNGYVGLAGASMGGQVALLAAIRDRSLDPIALVSPMIHESALDPAEYPTARDAPDAVAAAARATDVLGRTDGLAPRRILIVHGSHDPAAPAGRVLRLFDLLAPSYRDAPERLTLVLHPDGHGAPDALLDVVLDRLVAACLSSDR